MNTSEARRMMSTENPDTYEVTCLDCGTTKTYFTEQGATYFKMNHQGHNLKVKVGGVQAPQEPVKADAASPPAPTRPPRAEKKVAPAPVIEAPPEGGDEHVGGGALPAPVRLAGLVVDVIDNGEGRVVGVYGVASGKERFSKTFNMRDLSNLNLFLESGSYTDPSTLASYTWTPEKIDLSEDVARMLDESTAGGTATKKVVESAETIPANPPQVAADPGPEPTAKSAAPTKSVTEEALLGKLSYIQPGEEYALESMRVSRVLRRFRWNTELPYVIGAMFDDLLSVQAQGGAVKGEVIEAVGKLGYTFVAVEAPSGTVTAWFRKNDKGQDLETENCPV